MFPNHPMFMRNPLFNGPIPNPPQHFNQRFPNWNHLLAAAWNQSILQSLQQRAAMVNNNGMIAHPSPRISPANGNPIQTNGNHIQMNGNHTPNNRGNNFTVDRIMNSPMAAERLRAEESAKSILDSGINVRIISTENGQSEVAEYNVPSFNNSNEKLTNLKEILLPEELAGIVIKSGDKLHIGIFAKQNLPAGYEIQINQKTWTNFSQKSETESMANLIVLDSVGTFSQNVAKNEEIFLFNKMEESAKTVTDPIQQPVQNSFDVADESDMSSSEPALNPDLSPMNGSMSPITEEQMDDNNGKGYQCDRCGKVFSYRYYRDKHLKYTRCVDQGDRKFPCHLCSRSFEKRDRLRIHILHVHEKHRPHCCQVCGKRFSQSSSLNKHLRVHSGERPYKCLFCGKAFTASSILRTHIRQHSGEKPFKCKFCGKSFASHAAHDSHVRRTHATTKAEANQCTLCGKSFQHASHLRFHIHCIHSNFGGLPSGDLFDMMTAAGTSTV